MKVALIVNPAAAGGSGARAAPAAQRALERGGANVVIHATRGPGDARRLANLSRDEGADVIAVVGGDGTLNEVSQAYLGADGEPRPGPALALIPFGTGGDFRKTLGLGKSLDEAVERLLKSEPRPLDLGIVRATGHDGSPVLASFLNITSFGLGGLTDRLVNAGPKWLGGKAAFFLGSLRGLAAYENAPVRVRVDGNVWLESPIVNVAIANGRYFGGGMLIAPHADPSDGMLDVVALGDLTRLQVIGLSNAIYAGEHLERTGVSSTRGVSIEAEALVPRAEVLIDMDGETPGRLPLLLTVARGALLFRA